MNTETMTIHEALCELKTLDERIAKKTSLFVACEANRRSNDKIHGVSVEAHINAVKAQYQSIRDMIKRRNAIKSALSLSNAKATVTINNRAYTIAEAIEMKRSGIQQLCDLTRALSASYTNVQEQIRKQEQKLPDLADNYVSGLYGSKERINSEEAKRTREVYIEQNTIDMIDPLHALGEIEQLDEEISAFTTKVDSAISIANATTTITISY